MKVGDIVKHDPSGDEMTHLLYEAEGLLHDFDIGLVLDVKPAPDGPQFQVYYVNETQWYGLRELKKIR